jgi:aspartate-semialdehyde dehydrogenase
MKLAIVGVTGLVGQTMLQVLTERNFEIDELIPVASKKSMGREVNFKDKKYKVTNLETALELRPDIALFSAGGSISKEWAPKFAEVGTRVIDNSSAFRMDPTKKLIVPEINAREITDADKIIANPNCSTIQLVMALKPLHNFYKIKRVIVSTYQSISGSGSKAVNQFENEIKGEKGEMAYPYPIHKNAIPHCDVFQENDYTKEEMKLTDETKKILGDDSVLVSATAVRIPVVGGHSEAVNIEFENEPDIKTVKKLLSDFSGIFLQDQPDTNTYPMPFFAKGKNDVFIGRVRKDHSHPKAINMWIVTDNLRKGAATNAVQIAEKLVEKPWSKVI